MYQYITNYIRTEVIVGNLQTLNYLKTWNRLACRLLWWYISSVSIFIGNVSVCFTKYPIIYSIYFFFICHERSRQISLGIVFNLSRLRAYRFKLNYIRLSRLRTYNGIAKEKTIFRFNRTGTRLSTRRMRSIRTNRFLAGAGNRPTPLTATAVYVRRVVRYQQKKCLSCYLIKQIKMLSLVKRIPFTCI